MTVTLASDEVETMRQCLSEHATLLGDISDSLLEEGFFLSSVATAVHQKMVESLITAIDERTGRNAPA